MIGILWAAPATAQSNLPAKWNFMDAQEQEWWVCREDPIRATARCRTVTRDGQRPIPDAKQMRGVPTLPNYSFARPSAAEELRGYDNSVAFQRRYQPPSAPIYQPYSPPISVPQLPSYEAPGGGSSYDWRSGNSYNWYKDSLGNTTVSGRSLTTGSMWRTEIKPDGSMTGHDKNFDYWKYSADTKTYMNFGTGATCVGEGYARVCAGQ